MLNIPPTVKTVGFLLVFFMKHWDDRDASSGRWALYFEEEDMSRGVNPEIIIVKQKEKYVVLLSGGKPSYVQHPLKADNLEDAKTEAENLALQEYLKEIKGYEREVSVYQKKIYVLKGEKQMKTVYPVLFIKTEECVLVEVPDLDILTEGKDMYDAIKMARDAISLMLVSKEDAGLNIPEPSESTTIDTTEGAFLEEGPTVLSLVDVDTEEYRETIKKKE